MKFSADDTHAFSYYFEKFHQYCSRIVGPMDVDVNAGREIPLKCRGLLSGKWPYLRQSITYLYEIVTSSYQAMYVSVTGKTSRQAFDQMPKHIEHFIKSLRGPGT